MIRAWNLAPEQAITEPGPLGVPVTVGYELLGGADVWDMYLLDPNTMVVRWRLNRSNTPLPFRELKLTRQ